MNLLRSALASHLYLKSRGTCVTSVMSSPAVANGVKRAPAAAEDGVGAKKQRAEQSSDETVAGDAAAAAAADGGTVPAADQPEVARETADAGAGASADAERLKLKKMLLLVSYSGKGYQGMQRNPGCRTIEEDLLTALHKAHAIPEHGLREQQSIWFQRAARTDKGVSAAKQSVSLRMAAEDGVLETVNAHLPPQIRVFDMKRVTKRFDAKLQCCARTYMYMSPTFAFCPMDGVVSEEYRITEDVLHNVNRLFKKYVGTHNYHNFTSRRKPSDPSNRRYIMSMESGKPFVRENIEFTVITVKGQSFMLHQIRKMIGLVMAVSRGLAAEAVFDRAWSLDRIDLPVAPALGLLLHEVHYDRYNKRFGSGGSNTHENIEWSGVEDKIRTFREEFIFPDIVQTEVKEKSMLSWLATLPLHTFDIREDDQNPLQEARKLADGTAPADKTAAAEDPPPADRTAAAEDPPPAENHADPAGAKSPAAEVKDAAEAESAGGGEAGQLKSVEGDAAAVDGKPMGEDGVDAAVVTSPKDGSSSTCKKGAVSCCESAHPAS